jgi:antitoxin ParD1/3/4
MWQDEQSDSDVRSPTMTITIPADYQRFVEQLVGKGGYDHPGEVICDGLDLLRAQTIYRDQKLAELRAQVDIGVQQMKRGEVVEVDPMKVFEEIDQEFKAKARAKR